MLLHLTSGWHTLDFRLFPSYSSLLQIRMGASSLYPLLLILFFRSFTLLCFLLIFSLHASISVHQWPPFTHALDSLFYFICQIRFCLSRSLDVIKSLVSIADFSLIAARYIAEAVSLRSNAGRLPKVVYPPNVWRTLFCNLFVNVRLIWLLQPLSIIMRYHHSNRHSERSLFYSCSTTGT